MACLAGQLKNINWMWGIIVIYFSTLQTENKAMGQKLAVLNQRHDQAVRELEALHTTLQQMEDDNEQLAEQLKVAIWNKTNLIVKILI